MNSIFWYVLAAFSEIGGCYTVWLWLRQHRSPLWLIPGVLALSFFAFSLTRIDSEDAGRAFASYGGIYVICSLFWLWIVEGVTPNHHDLIGAIFCLLGTAIILFGIRPRW